MRESHMKFVRQQGFRKQDASEQLFAALQFQPKVIGVVLAVGVWLQSAWLFVALAVVLWWCALVPALNVFDLLYNRLIADRLGRRRAAPAPEPRRFAQGLASMLSALIAAALASGAQALAWLIEALLAAAVLAIAFASFCFGSWLYARLHRALLGAEYANRGGLGEDDTDGDVPVCIR